MQSQKFVNTSTLELCFELFVQTDKLINTIVLIKKQTKKGSQNTIESDKTAFKHHKFDHEQRESIVWAII